MMCVLHRKWKTAAELCEHRYGGALQECSSRLSVICTTEFAFSAERIVLFNTEKSFLKKRLRIWGFYLAAISETQLCYKSKLWEPESGTYDKQKVKLTYLILFFKPKVVQYRPSSHPV